MMLQWLSFILSKISFRNNADTYKINKEEKMVGCSVATTLK